MKLVKYNTDYGQMCFSLQNLSSIQKCPISVDLVQNTCTIEILLMHVVTQAKNSGR